MTRFGGAGVRRTGVGMTKWCAVVCLVLMALLPTSCRRSVDHGADQTAIDNANNLSLTETALYGGRDRNRRHRSGDDNDDRPHVVESENLGADWDCYNSINCVQDYLDFLERADDYATSVSDAELAQMFREFGLMSPFRDAIPAAELRQDILDRLNSSFLYDGLDERRLEVITVAVETTAFGVKRTVVFRDPWVGTCKGFLLLPGGAGPFPSVVVIHGHGQSGESYVRDFP